ncbi:MAG: hypothetical protein CVU38_09805 [Chloroflexi bacterium HGW-Chloroflexi-1]|nr:MAG: hypothetical protein CVU38_09805 [Chloroflexi bacterium HGW-Chloroflexi-1]
MRSRRRARTPGRTPTKRGGGPIGTRSQATRRPALARLLENPSAAAVAVAPKLSATEGSGKLLTYMAAGLPVVAFDTAVHREYLGELGVYATAGDAGALAQALAGLLDDPQTATIRGQALRKMAFSHTWEYTAISIETVYQGLQ